MRRTHRLSAKSIRCTSLCTCLALILSSLALITPASSKSAFVFQGQNGQGTNRNAKKVPPSPPQPGAPVAVLPNLDEARQQRNEKPKAPREIESTMRSRRKPLESRHGRKVGDPLPPKSKASAASFGYGSERVSIDGAESRGSVGTTRSHHARTTRSLPVVSASSLGTLLKLINGNRSLANHSTFDFLHYPAFHSDPNSALVQELHRRSDSKSIAPQKNIDSESFDLFLSPLPQSGSSKIVF